MTTLPKAARIHHSPDEGAFAPHEAPSPAAPVAPAPASADQIQAELAAIEAEGLTKRQLRMASRAAQRAGLNPSSPHDAVRLLRAAGQDPFQRSNLLEEVDESTPAAAPNPGSDKVQLPQVVQPAAAPAKASPVSALEERASEIRKMQLDIARRRRRNLFLMTARLLFFILLPTAVAATYFYRIATPMYATSSEFVIQKASSASGAAAGLGGLFQGTSMATQQDSISVQSYLSSIAAMERLDGEHQFRATFTSQDIDALQRLAPNATQSESYSVYKKRIRISYDPTEGLIRMEVSAPTPARAVEFNEALIRYAEEQVDQMTSRLRSDQMRGALSAYESAEAARAEALRELTQLQADAEVLDPKAESSALMSRINRLETEKDKLVLELAGLQDNPRPNAARVAGLEASIRRMDEQIGQLRSAITQSTDRGRPQTEINAEIREAEENYQARLRLVQEALAQREAAQIEANRQVRYLSLSVPPSLPDAPSYPRGFENTAMAFMVFSGIYLIIALSAAVVREQITA